MEKVKEPNYYLTKLKNVIININGVEMKTPLMKYIDGEQKEELVPLTFQGMFADILSLSKANERVQKIVAHNLAISIKESEEDYLKINEEQYSIIMNSLDNDNSLNNFMFGQLYNSIITEQEYLKNQEANEQPQNDGEAQMS